MSTHVVNSCCTCAVNEGVGGCGMCACRDRGGRRRGRSRGGGGIGVRSVRVGCVATSGKDRESGGCRVRRRRFRCAAAWGQDRDRGGAGSREAGTGVLGDRFQTRETGTMVWLTGVLLSVVNNCLVTWISGWVAGLYALLLGTLQCPFDLHLAMASPWYPQFYQTSVSQREQLYMC